MNGSFRLVVFNPCAQRTPPTPNSSFLTPNYDFYVWGAIYEK